LWYLGPFLTLILMLLLLMSMYDDELPCFDFLAIGTLAWTIRIHTPLSHADVIVMLLCNLVDIRR
jgi:hypothetical protein